MDLTKSTWLVAKKKEMEKGHYNRERNSNTNESAMVVETPKKKK